MRVWGWALVGVSIAATAAAVALRPPVAVEAALSALAIVSASVLLLLLLFPSLPPRVAVAATPYYPPDHLERSFTSGDLGRQRLISAIESLEVRLLLHHSRRPPAEVDRLRRVSDEEFRAWISGQLAVLELNT